MKESRKAILRLCRMDRKRITPKRLAGLMAYSVIVTLLALFLSNVVTGDLGTLKSYSKVDTSGDFITSDFAKRYVWMQNQDLLANPDVIVVATDGCHNRKELAEALHKVRAARPKAIGLDMYFKVRSNEDSVLLAEITACDNIVLPYDVYGTHRSYFSDSLPENVYLGVSNMVDNRREGTCRSFIPCWGKGMRHSLAAHLACIYDTTLAVTMAARPGDKREINFTNGRPFCIEASEIEDYADRIEGRIALLGDICAFDDLHYTPVDDSMPGVMLQAYVLCTILDNSYYRLLPEIWFTVLGSLLCFLLVFGKCYVKRFRVQRPFLPLAWRCVQVLLLLLMLFASCMMLSSAGYSVNMAKPLLIVAFCGLAADLWSGFSAIVRGITRLCVNGKARKNKLIRKLL